MTPDLTTPCTTRFASRVIQGVAIFASRYHDTATNSGCLIKSRWLRRGGLIAIVFFIVKGLFWLGLLWWFGNRPD